MLEVETAGVWVDRRGALSACPASWSLEDAPDTAEGGVTKVNLAPGLGGRGQRGQTGQQGMEESQGERSVESSAYLKHLS